ncbi:TonB-dependent receptor [Abyssalbus ytuae]|uniref:TonB-dependent receptor n=1 Tax=Abyssalbus ytuae TaxID=2926907 RepID=A0A9E6ZIH8_9FLAO|nr:TonB-dependent receptor [Abyssalbus ytuae]UOB16157.1 TonB-dependent receptor [Abyssalbus ytuae]
MMKSLALTTTIILFFTQFLWSQNPSIIGKITSNKDNLSYATASVKNTNIGAITNDEGLYEIKNLHPGTYTIVARIAGFKPQEKEIELKQGQTLTLDFQLEEDILGLEEIVITANRSRINRRKATTIVNVINPEIFQTTQSVTLGEGLSFCSGLRMENNCQNCGFSQVRMNGLEGPYSQILINSRPIFSGLAGVYGLELIPSNMIKKVEVIRGGGSALYGNNAIAGTINLIVEEPIQNSYEIGYANSLIGVGVDNVDDPATDYNLQFNTSLISDNNKSALALYGFHRNRKPFDANDDSFSEISKLKNSTLGAKLFQKFGTKGKLSLDFFHVNEERRGGDKFELPNHEAGISEAVEHHLTTVAANYDQYYSENDLLSVFASGQYINRDSYYGAEQSLSDYGNTKDKTLNIGVQYNTKISKGDIIFGFENTSSHLKDMKLGYPDYDNAVIEDGEIVSIPHTDNIIVSHQKMNTLGLFSQYEFSLNKLKLTLGARFDHYDIQDEEHDSSDKSGNVFSPRINMLYDINNKLQARLSYSQGYRSPQIFDEDLHIETSGSRQVIHRNSDDLEQETSNSIMASLDYNHNFGDVNLGFLVEAFYTKLTDPFANEFSDPDENGVIIYTRVNAEGGAEVSGVNLELTLVPSPTLSITGGFTIQKSEYDEAQEFNEKSFFRTPDNYGFLTLDWDPKENWELAFTANYTGKMLVPYFGVDAADTEEGELRKSDSFLDLGTKISYRFKINDSNLELSTGIKNIFNSYQDDFDTGINRDPAYIYGPLNPRTIYAGIKLSNLGF